MTTLNPEQINPELESTSPAIKKTFPGETLAADMTITKPETADSSEFTESEAKVSVPSGVFYDLIYWKAPLYSGLCVGAATAAFYVLVILQYSVLRLVCNVLLAAITLSLAYVGAHHLLTRVGILDPSSNKLFESLKNAEKKAEMSSEEVTAVCQIIARNVVRMQAYLRSILLCESLAFTLKTAFALYCVSSLCAIFGDFTLAYLIFLGVFTLPVGYVHNQKLVDDVVEKAFAKAKEGITLLKQKAQENLPPQVANALSKVKLN